MTRHQNRRGRPVVRIATVAGALLLASVLAAAAGWWARTSLAQQSMGPAAVGQPRQGTTARGIDQPLEEADAALAKIMEGQVDAPTSVWRMEEEPPFEVPSRTLEMFFYPCSDCHAEQVADFRVRELEDEHFDLRFNHGAGRFWCYDACHNPDNIDQLISMRGRPVEFDASYKVCGQCHQENLKDWYFGAHGKRTGAFMFAREIPKEADNLVVSDREEIGKWTTEEASRLNCPFCHDPHAPAIQPFEPSPPPQVRKGLEQHRVEAGQHEPVWAHLNRKDGADHE